MPLKDPKGSGIPPLNRGQMNYSLLGVVGALLLLLAMNFILIPKSTITMVDFSDFKKLIGDGSIKRVEMTLSAYYGFSLTKEESALRQKEPQDKSGRRARLPRRNTRPPPCRIPSSWL